MAIVIAIIFFIIFLQPRLLHTVLPHGDGDYSCMCDPSGRPGDFDDFSWIMRPSMKVFVMIWSTGYRQHADDYNHDDGLIVMIAP